MSSPPILEPPILFYSFDFLVSIDASNTKEDILLIQLSERKSNFRSKHWFKVNAFSIRSYFSKIREIFSPKPASSDEDTIILVAQTHIRSKTKI